MAETIYDLDPDQFELYLKEKGYDKEREAFLRDQYAQNRTLSGQTRAALGEATQTEEGRRRLSILPMTVPEGMSGSEAIREGEWEWATPGLITGTAEEAARAVETGEKMRMGLEVPQEDVEEAAFFGAEAALVGGLSTAGRSAFDYDPEQVNMFLGDMAQSKELLPQSTGADGKTRYELSDAKVDGVSVSPYNISFTNLSNLTGDSFEELLEEGKITTVGDVLDHPQLYEAYPQIEDIPITVDESLDEGTLGYFRPTLNLIAINKKQIEKPLGFKNTLLHEIQHWIQEKEDFERGTNPSSQEVFNKAPGVRKELQKIRDERYAKLLETSKKALANYYQTTEHRDTARAVVGDVLEFLEESGESADKLEKYLISGERSLALGELLPLFQGSKAVLGAEEEVLGFQNKGVFPVSESAYTPVEDLKTEIVFLVEDLARYSEGDSKLSELFEKKYSIKPKEFLDLGFTKRREELETSGFLIERPKIPESRPLVSTKEGLRETYLRKAGEVEARNVGSRMELSQGERGEYPPETTEDRPRDVQWGRSFAEGGTVENQMDKLLKEGGMADDGRDRDPVSGNEIPPGSTAKEVRDDVDVKLSEGEYVVPADVVQYYGVKFFEDLRSKAKDSLKEMDEDGRIGGEPVMEDEELTPEEVQMLQEALGPQGMNEGGMVSQPAFSGYGGTNPTVPGAGTPFTPYGGSTFGGGGTEIRSYINPDTGQTRSFMFINGQPVGTIPEGFVPNTQENRERAQQTQRQTQAVRTEGTRDDGPSFDPATRGAGGSKGTSFADRMGAMQGLSDADLASAVKGYSNDIAERSLGMLGGVLGAGPAGVLAGRGIGVAAEAEMGYNTAVEAARRGLEAERAGDTESAESYMDLANEALTESRWNSALPDLIGTRMTMDDVMKDARRAATIDTDPFALESDLSNFEQALQDAEEDPYGSTVAAEGRFSFAEKALEDPESMLPPSPTSSSSSSGGRSSIAADFASRAEAGTLGTISADEFGSGSSSGGSSSSSSSGGFADDPAGKDGPTGGAGSGGGGGGSGGGCVVATHAVSTGAFTPEDKQRAVDWCCKNLHGNWFGETFRRGYRRVGNKYIDKGTVTNYYQEFEDYVNFVTGKKRNLKGFLTFLYRTPQLFVLGLFTKEK